jgi:protocatechuate 3,4-dioxygenase beta subunit
MLSHKLRLITPTLLSLGAIAAGADCQAHASAMSDDPKDSPAGPPSAVATRPDDANPSPAPGRMFVVGRVLDPTGKPVPDASVAVHARDRSLGRAPFTSRFQPILLGDARADGSGRFRIDAPRTSSARHELYAVALAPNYGAGWVELDPDHDQPTAEIALRLEQVIHGRVFDLQGRPVPEVRLSVGGIGSDLPQPRAGLHHRSVYRRSDGFFYGTGDAPDLPAWPRPMTTDSEGRFTLRGVGRKLHATLAVHHPRFARQTIRVDTDDDSESKTVTAALAPSQIVNVRVTYADTGRPVPHAPLQVLAAQARSARIDEAETDDDGRARVNSFPTERGYGFRAYPPEGQPYLMANGNVNWLKGALEQTLNIALPRGVPIRGRVTEEGSGKPVPGALVDFTTRRGPSGRDQGMSVLTGSDGSFQLGAEPKPGHLFAMGPDDYVLQTIGSRLVLQGEPGGGRIYSHAYAALDLKTGMASQEVNLVLRRGATVEGRVVGPDGQPVRDAWFFSRLVLDPSRGAWRSWTGGYHGKLREGRFEIRGLAPDAEVPVYFLEPVRKLGAVVTHSSRSAADGPVTVRLEPCGSAQAWLVDPDGKPVAKPVRGLDVNMVVTPGAAGSFFANDQTSSLLSADEDDLTTVDPINYEKGLAPDAGGRITLPVLIPGATYRFIDYTMYVRGQVGPEIRKEFAVKAGQKLDLGNILVAKPPR